MFKYLLLLFLFVNSNAYASKKVICQIVFDVPNQMDKKFDKMPIHIIFNEMINYDKDETRAIKKNIIGDVKDSFYRTNDLIENDKVFSVKEKYYVLDSYGASISVRESSCLNYSKKIELELNEYLKEKNKKLISKKEVQKKQIVKKEKEFSQNKKDQKPKKINQPINDEEKDLIKKALELAL